ncbi:hypothetical protein QUF74_19240 [Candidatus Halobeggiatoa sp. HSG11]|nr:hypothetical protein [Candidatus Halobeggiatoa sp. HSG11]
MIKKLILVLLLAMSYVTQANDIEFTDAISQNQFEEFTKEFGTALLFNPMAPAEPLGMLGFDVALETVVTDISDEQEFWINLVSDNDPVAYLPVPRLHVQKGLPFNIDVGAMYVSVPSTNIKLWGLEAKYAILEGSTLTPALSVRASYTNLSGVDDVSIDTQALDILVSKGFLMFTPYAGASIFRVNGSENTDIVELDDVNVTGYRALVGMQVSPFPLMIINAEVSLGEVPQYGLKIGLRF